MSGRFACVLSITLGILLVLFLSSQPVQAQTSSLEIIIATPTEGETLYAGPETLAFTVPLTGWVYNAGGVPVLVRVQLDVLQDSTVVTVANTRPAADGSFMFDLAVNPDAPFGIFNPEHSSCLACHNQFGIGLPRGETVLRVTATDPAGRTAMAQRRITVDRSGQAAFSLRVVLDGDSSKALAGIRVTGSTWLYMWRSRFTSVITGASGEAQSHVEALAQASTHYTFRVDPTVVDGVLYEGVEPVTVTLAPGATSVPPIALKVRSRTGQISGTLLAPTTAALASVPIRAIHLPDGVSYRVQTSAQGAFAFSDLPIGQYLLTVESNARGLTSDLQTLDLAQSPTTSIALPVQNMDHLGIRSMINDDTGASVPFAWVTLDQAGITRALLPGITDLIFPVLPFTPITTSVTAPGFYSQQQTITPTIGSSAQIELNLARRSETRTLSWGNGQVIVPPESQVAIDNQQIALTRGWLWGHGNGQTIAIRTPEAQVTISRGAFALERVSDAIAWLYVTQGNAMVSANSGAPVMVGAGEMVALMSGKTPRPVPLDSTVTMALHPSTDLPIISLREPTRDELASTQIAQGGVGIAQAVTFLTYSAIALIVLFIQLAALVWSTRRRKIPS